MKKIVIALILAVVCLLALVSSQSVEVTDEYGKITEFEVLDNPYDDGSGVILKWKPLPQEQRVIQYRIYRGITPDSLFLLSHIEIDPALGVIGDELYFYDKDYQVFFDLESASAKLRKEKTPDPQSPLYGSIPRDPKIMQRLIPHFTVLGAIKQKNFYHRSRKVVDEQENTSAGYRVHQFENMYANPVAGNTYYYTVLAVNEKGRLLPHAGIKEIVPMDNRPDTTGVIHTAYVQDIDEWNFEWSAPLNSDDIYLWEAWLMPKNQLSLYHSEQEKNTQSMYEGNFDAWQSKSIQLFEYPNDLMHTIPVHFYAMKPQEMGLSLPTKLDEYRVVLGYTDFSGLKAYSLGREIRNMQSADKPLIPHFTVQDTPNDKGDGITISIGKPLAYINQAAFTDKEKRRMMINYELSENFNYKVRSVVFEFYTPDGTKIGTATEHFIDKTLTYTFPKEYSNIKAMDIHIFAKYANGNDTEDTYSKQSLTFEEKYRRFVSGDVYYNGQNLSKRYYDIASITRLDLDYFPGKRINTLARLYDDIVSYEDVLYKQITDVDPKTKLLKLSPDIVIEANPELGDMFSASIYRDVFTKKMDDMKAQIEELSTEAGKYDAASVPDSISTVLQHQQAMYEYITNHPAYIAAESAKSDRSWLRTLVNTRQQNARTFSYKMRLTDGKGLFSTSEPYTIEGETVWTYPQSEWFDTTKYPTLVGSLVLALLVVYTVLLTKRGKELYIRPIAGLEELDNAIGRATEMGRPVMFVPGWGTLGDVCTIASMMILNQVAKKTAEFDVRLISPNCDYYVVPLAQEMVKTAYSEVGRPDSFNQNDIFFVSDMQFAFSAAVNGVTIRERVATIFYMGFFNAESLLMTETGNQCGAIQIAGTDATTQIPFFITTCDYTLIGEEFYAASAYMSQDRDLVSMLKAQDYYKIIIVAVVTVGVILSTLNYNALVNVMPLE